MASSLEPIYWGIGAMVFFNIGTIVTIIVYMVKISFWVGQFKGEVQLGIAESKDCAVRAHKRIDKIEVTHEF